MARPSWKLTVRNGAEVAHEGYDDLDQAVATMRERALAIRAEAPPKTSNVLRTFKPSQQVQGRLELSGRGLFGKPVAGVDVRGDGSFVPYKGGGRREELDPTNHDTPFDLVRETLEREKR